VSADLDPRIERSRRVITEAAIEEMAEVGYGAMTVEAIAKRAGVSKATIYRQWQSKLEIVEGALDLIKSEIVVDEDLPPRDRVVQMVAGLATHLADVENPASACVPAMVSAAQYDGSVRAFHHRFSAERRQVLIDLITDGQTVGAIDPKLDPVVTVELLVGPIFYRRLMTEAAYPPDDIGRLVDTVLGPA